MKDRKSKEPRIVIEYATPGGVLYADLTHSFYLYYLKLLASVKNVPPTMDNLIIRGSDESSGLEITFEPSVNEAWDTGHLTANVCGYQNGVIMDHKPFQYQIEKVEPKPDQPLGKFTAKLIDPGQVQVTGVHVVYRDDYRWAGEAIGEVLAGIAPLYGEESLPITFHPVSNDIFLLKVERIMQVVAISESPRNIVALADLDPELMVDELNSGKPVTFHVPPEWMQGLLGRVKFASLPEFQQEIKSGKTVALVIEGKPPPFISKVYKRIAYDPISSKLMAAVLGYVIVHRVIESIWPKKKKE